MSSYSASNALVVVICTHNPRKEVFSEVLSALQRQTLKLNQWALLIVDNASSITIAEVTDIAWHPNSKVIREDKLGTAHARMRALRETLNDDLLLFVDDDNILSPDYLETGLIISRAQPWLGCWGGQLKARFAVPPPSWLQRYYPHLAISTFDKAKWGNFVTNYGDLPPSAGCFIRKAVRAEYLRLLDETPERLSLGARGDVQIRGEDTDLLATTLDLGLGFGRFPNLIAEHVIPEGRMSISYMTNLLEGVGLGSALVQYFRTREVPKAASFLDELRFKRYVKTLCAEHRILTRAERRGAGKARTIIESWKSNGIQFGQLKKKSQSQ